MTSKRRSEVPKAAKITRPPRPILYVPRAILQDTFTYFLPYCRGSAQKWGLQNKRETPKVKGNETLLNHERSILSCMSKYRSQWR
jgi:hypothetical protein